MTSRRRASFDRLASSTSWRARSTSASSSRTRRRETLLSVSSARRRADRVAREAGMLAPAPSTGPAFLSRLSNLAPRAGVASSPVMPVTSAESFATAWTGMLRRCVFDDRGAAWEAMLWRFVSPSAGRVVCRVAPWELDDRFEADDGVRECGGDGSGSLRLSEKDRLGIEFGAGLGDRGRRGDTNGDTGLEEARWAVSRNQ